MIMGRDEFAGRDSFLIDGYMMTTFSNVNTRHTVRKHLSPLLIISRSHKFLENRLDKVKNKFKNAIVQALRRHCRNIGQEYMYIQ